MSSFDISTLVNEISSIVGAPGDNPTWYYEAAVLVGENQFTAYKVISMDTLRDYGTAYADKIILELTLPAGTFLHDILPFKEDLRVLLVKRTQSTLFGIETDKPIKQTVFRATLLQTDSPLVASSEQAAKAGRAALNLMDIRRVSFQLQDIVMEQLRLVTFGTVFREIRPGDLLKGLFSRTSDFVKVDQENSIKGVTMVDADNVEMQNHLVIPHSTKLIDIPDLLQSELCGIYNSGLGFYLQNKMWYLWPLYNFKRFDKAAKTVTIILIPSNKLQGVEKTYRTTQNQLIIIVTGGTIHSDNSEAKLLNEGNGVRFPDSRRMIEGFGAVKGNKVVADRGANGSQFVGVPRVSKLNVVQSGKMSNNIYNETSKLASRAGSQMMVNWQNSDPDLLTPAMACQVIFERDGLPVTLDACIVGSHSQVSSPETSTASKRHLTNTVLSLFVDKNLPELKEFAQSGKVDQYSRPV